MKKIADKRTKELVFETELKDLNRSKNEFTTSWQGRIIVTDAARSQIAKEVHIEKNGEYAIKVR